MSEFVRVCALSELSVGEIKAATVGFRDIVLARTEKSVFALANECTHDGAPIANGKLRGDSIMCTRHGARFDLATGQVAAPPAIVPLDSFEVRIVGDDILVKVNE